MFPGLRTQSGAAFRKAGLAHRGPSVPKATVKGGPLWKGGQAMIIDPAIVGMADRWSFEAGKRIAKKAAALARKYTPVETGPKPRRKPGTLKRSVRGRSSKKTGITYVGTNTAGRLGGRGFGSFVELGTKGRQASGVSSMWRPGRRASRQRGRTRKAKRAHGGTPAFHMLTKGVHDVKPFIPALLRAP